MHCASGAHLSNTRRCMATGTGRRAARWRNCARQGRDVVLRIDVQGAMQVREQYPEAILIFVAPPSLQELEQRLRRRGRDDEEAIQLRLMNAREEMEYIPRYDYLVINDDLNRALETLRCILIAERHRVRNLMTQPLQEVESA
jgi:guanylate kinase